MAPVLDATAAESERLGTLCGAAVDALHDERLFGIWVPAEAGGFAADLVTQVDAMIALGRADMSACWTVMIGTTVTGTMAAGLPDDGFAEVFAGERMPVAAGSLRPDGRAAPLANGGYRVTGKWGFGSGIHHAEWIVANCLAAEAEESGGRVALAVPVADVRIADDWRVSGLRGSGSSSYSVQGVEVPPSRVLGKRRRGGYLSANPAPRIPLEHASVSLGGARRALDEIACLSRTKRRLGSDAAVADSDAFRQDLGRLEAEWSALAAGVRAVAAELDAAVTAGEDIEPVATRLKAVCALATARSLAIGGRALRHAGAGAVYDTGTLQRVHRDLVVSAQHVMVSDAAFEAYGGQRLEEDGPG